MSAACLSLHFRGGDCEARAPWDSQWVLFCDSGECRLQPLQTSEPGESLRTASRGAGAGRAGAGRPRPHSAGRAPGSTSHYPAPLASPDRPPPGQGGPRGGMEAALRAPQARGASESPVRPTSHQPGPPASPDGSPCRPTARAHPPSGGAEGAEQQWRRLAHAVAMETRLYGGSWRTRSSWRRPAVRRPVGAKPRGGRLGTMLRLRAGAGLGGKTRRARRPHPALLGGRRHGRRWSVPDSGDKGAEAQSVLLREGRGRGEPPIARTRRLAFQVEPPALPALYLPACSRQTSFLLRSHDGGPGRRHQPDTQLPGGQGSPPPPRLRNCP